MLEKDEQQLIEELKAGNQEAFKVLYNKHLKEVTIIAYLVLRDTDDAKDVAQNVFIALWKIREKLNIRKSIKAYLSVATNNECNTWIKKKKSKFNREKEFQATQPDHSLPPQLQAEDITEEQLKELDKVLESAPEDQAKSFKLFYKERLSQKEIANDADLSVSRVKKQIASVRKLLFLKLKQK